MSNSFLLCRAVLVLVAGALLPGARSRAADANCFPDDTELVVTVNLKQIFGSEVVKAQPDAVGELKEVLGQFAGVHTVQKYLKEAGLDAFQDLTRITYGYTGSKDPKVTFLVLEGQFSAEKLTTATKVEGGALRAKKSGNDTIYESTPRGEKQLHAALVNASTLIVATTAEALTDALARAAGTKKSALKKEMRKLLEVTEDRQSITFVSSGTAFARLVAGFSIPNAESAVAFLQTLDAFSGGVTLAKGVEFQLTFNADSEETAKKLTESASGAVRILHTLVQQTAEKDAKYVPVIDVVKSFRFTQQGAGILFRGEMTLDTVEQLIKNFPPSLLPKDRK